MNFTEMHDRLRLQIQRRIQRGTASVTLLARQTGIGHSHLSNFLNCKRKLSLAAADRIMAAQRISAVDLLSTTEHTQTMARESAIVPVVSYAAALFEPHIRPAAGREWIHVPERLLRSARGQPSARQRSWQRFVAVAVPAEEAQAMSPVLMEGALVLLDRHYNSLTPYHSGRLTLYAVCCRNRLLLRYAEFDADRMVLRPHNLASPVEVIEMEPGQLPRDLIAGRVAMVMNGH